MFWGSKLVQPVSQEAEAEDAEATDAGASKAPRKGTCSIALRAGAVKSAAVRTGLEAEGTYDVADIASAAKSLVRLPFCARNHVVEKEWAAVGSKVFAL